jgi:hypothetical protein
MLAMLSLDTRQLGALNLLLDHLFNNATACRQLVANEKLFQLLFACMQKHPNDQGYVLGLEILDNMSKGIAKLSDDTERESEKGKMCKAVEAAGGIDALIKAHAELEEAASERIQTIEQLLSFFGRPILRNPDSLMDLCTRFVALRVGELEDRLHILPVALIETVRTQAEGSATKRSREPRSKKAEVPSGFGF